MTTRIRLPSSHRPSLFQRLRRSDTGDILPAALAMFAAALLFGGIAMATFHAVRWAVS